MNLKETLNGARERVTAWNEARKEKAAAKKALKAQHNTEHGHGRFWLVNIPATATICAALVEVYWAILFCIEATGRIDNNFDMAAAWNAPWQFMWDFTFSGNAPVLIGLLAATAPIVMISMVWLPVQFSMRGFGRWRRGTLIAVGLLCNAIVIISGTVVMNANRQDHLRGEMVVEQTADAGRAAIAARLSVAQAELARITDPGMTSNEARAARAGVAGWDTYIREAMADPEVPAADRQRIRRARGSAEAADALRARIEQLTVEQAVAAPTANTAVSVEDRVGSGMNGFSEQVKVYRPPLIAVGCTLIGILGAWWTLAMLMGLNPKDVLRSGWADDSHRIEDLRDQEPVVPERDAAGRVKMKPPRRKFTEADTGEEVEQALIPEHYRTLRRNKRTTVEIKPDIPPDETGVDYDGGARIATREEQAMSGAMVGEREELAAAVEPLGNGDQQANVEQPAESTPAEAVQDEITAQPEPPEQPLTEEEQAELNQSLAALGELEPESGPAPEPEQVEEAVAVDATPAPLAVEESLPADEAQADEAADETGPPQDDPQERDEPETRANRLLQPAK